MWRQAERCLAVAAVLVGSKCAPSEPERLLRTYATHVRQAVQFERSEPELFRSELPWYPAPRERTLEVDELRLGVFDYLPLRTCRLDDLVASRNTSLGRVMRASSRLVYEHRLVARLERCRQRLTETGERPTLVPRLDELIATKRELLPRHFWNATFASQELSEFFSLAAGPLGLSAEPMPSEIPRAFTELAALSDSLGSPGFEISSSDLERHFYVLQSAPYGGRLLQAIELLRFYLDDAAHALTEGLRDVSACNSEALEDVFRERYGARVQPYMARVHRDGRRVLRRIEDLRTSLHADAPPELDRFFRSYLSLNGDDSLWNRFERTIERHSRAWQFAFETCELAPTTS